MPTSFPYTKILIPVDFSDASVRSLRHGLDLAVQCGASVAVLFVVDTSFPYPDLFSFEDPKEDYFKVMRDRARAKMDEWLGKLPAAEKVAVQKLVGRGRPAAEIVSMADEVEADLILVSRHGQSGLRHAFMGSTTEAVIRSASCPVTVLPPLPSADEDPE